ncbi:MAG: PD40 domain-containing protein [Bacteroidetes bacterium]|nr:PD40 domain-containing protein [Bacteroidota bacterium]
MLRTIILLGFLIANMVATAQPRPTREELRAALKDASFNEKFEVADGFMYDKIYGEALFVWEIILEEDPTNANVLYKTGMCLIYLNREVEAISYFERAQYSVSKTYNPFSPLERNAPTEIFYYLAKSNHSKGNIDTAFYQYDFFLQNVKKKHSNYDLAILGITQCKVARKLMAMPKNYIITNMGSIINTPAPEYSPVITIDGSAIFFTSKRLRADSSNAKYINMGNGQHYEDIYVSYRGYDGNWENPKYLDFCRPNKNDASVSVSPDGTSIFVYQDLGGGDIYFSELRDTVFVNIIPFPAEELNTDAWETHATVSPDGNYLYFVSDRPGGLGGRDIYRLKKLPNGEWSRAMNLGPPVNTPYDEESPFLGADNKTMYFSSNGPASMGGFDIFVTQMDESEIWSTPENMGYPLNSFDDDIFYTTTADGLTGFYSSDKLEGEGDKDIYRVESEKSLIKNVAVLTGFIFTSDNSIIPKGITIEVTDLTDATPPKTYSPRRRDGGYVLTLKPCHTYELDYKLDGNTFYKTELYVPCNSSYQELKHELLLDIVNLEAVTLNADLPLNGTRWEFSNDDHFGNLSGQHIEIYEDQKLVYEEVINKYGQFPYKELDTDKSHLIKINEDDFDFCEDLILNLVDSSNTIMDTYTFKANCETKTTVSEYSTILTTPIFQYNFGYNKDKFDTHNEALQLYVKGIKQVIESGQKVTVVISSSASKVPTKSYASNQELANQRLKTGKDILIKLLKSEGIDVTQITFVEKEALVQGPEYNNDAVEKANIYQRYQYIKFEIQF